MEAATSPNDDPVFTTEKLLCLIDSITITCKEIKYVKCSLFKIEVTRRPVCSCCSEAKLPVHILHSEWDVLCWVEILVFSSCGIIHSFQPLAGTASN